MVHVTCISSNINNSLDSKLLQGQVSCHQTICGCWPRLCSWVDNARARAWLEPISLHSATILRCVAHKWHILCEALDAGSDGAHPLCCTCTSTTTIIPGIAVAWWARWGIIIHCNTYWLLTQECSLRSQDKRQKCQLSHNHCG